MSVFRAEVKYSDTEIDRTVSFDITTDTSFDELSQTVIDILNGNEWISVDLETESLILRSDDVKSFRIKRPTETL